MKKVQIITIISVLSLFVFAIDASASAINEAAPDFSLQDSNGKVYKLSDYKGKYVVLEWINFDCPFVRNHYDSKNMQNLQGLLVEQGVIWFSINSSAPGKQGNFDTGEINRRIQADGLRSTAYLVDSNGEVGRLYGAKTTPHIFLINPEGILIYKGAIDSVRGVKKEDIDRAVNYILQAFNEAKTGKNVTANQSEPYGCSVKY